MENDLNKNQAVTDSGLKEQPATAQDLNQPVTEKQVETLADGTDETKTVPYSELKKAIDEKNAAMEQVQLAQSQMAIVQANQQPVQQVHPQTILEQAMIDCGVTQDEMYGDVMVKVLNRKAELDTLQSQRTNATYANQQFEATHPDFSSAVGLRNPLTGQVQPSAEILKILTEKPYLTAAAYASSQGAYEIVMQQREMDKLQQQTTVQEEHLKQQEIDTKLAPVSGAAAAGGAIPSQTTGSITVEQQLANEQKVEAGELA